MRRATGKEPTKHRLWETIPFLHVDQERQGFCIEGRLKIWPAAGSGGEKEERILGALLPLLWTAAWIWVPNHKSEGHRMESSSGGERIHSVQACSRECQNMYPLAYKISKMRGCTPVNFLSNSPYTQSCESGRASSYRTLLHTRIIQFMEMWNHALLHERKLPEYDLGGNFLYDHRTATLGIPDFWKKRLGCCLRFQKDTVASYIKRGSI